MNKQEYIRTAEGYIKALPSMNKSKQTVIAYDLALRKFSAYIFEHDIDEITTTEIINFQTTLFETGIKANTIKHYLACLHAFFDYCQKTGTISNNPVNTAYLPKSQPIEYDILSQDEIVKILTDKPNKINKIYCRNYAIMVLLIQSGLRNSELRNLTLKDLDFENGTITVRHGKGDKCRIVAFPSLAREVVGEYLESGVRPSNLTENDYLFGSTCDENGIHNKNNAWRQFSINCLNALVKRYVKRVIGRETNIHCHSMRHCAASMWDEMGVSLRDMQKALGHSSLATTERIYTHVLNRQRATSNINAAFDSVTGV